MGRLTKGQSAWRGSVSSSALLASLGVIGLGASTSESLAACTGGPTSFVCSGAETTGQIVSVNNAAVSTVPGFSVNTSVGSLAILGNGALSYIDTNASALTTTDPSASGLIVVSNGDNGATPGSVTIQTNGVITGVRSGVYAVNRGVGTINVTTSGAVTGMIDYGILAVAENPAGTGISIDAASVSGGTVGIYAQNGGGGMTSVKATGLVSATNGPGISVTAAGTTGTGLSVDAAAVSGTSYGIFAQNNGGGMTSVTASGSVIATNGTGIYAYAMGAAGTGLTVKTADVTGTSTGITAQNNGGGLTSVKATGTVTATAGDGIFAAAAPGGTGFSLEAATVTGSGIGITALNNGGGQTSVKATGTITGTTGDGLIVRANGASGTGLSVEAAAVSGNGAGINALNNGAGLTSVKATGTVTGATGYGIFASAGSAGTGLSVEAAAVNGGTFGILAQNNGGGLTSVKATGTVTGTNDNGISVSANNSAGTGLSVEAGAVSGRLSGITVQNNGGGLTSVKATGTVTGTTDTGIFALANNPAGSGLSIQAAAVTGGIDGITAMNNGGGLTQVTATGLVKGTGHYGIVAANNILALNGSGDLTVISSQGTNLATAVSVQASGGVTGGLTGVLAYNAGSGQLQVDTRGGAVSGSTREGILAMNYRTAGTPTDLSVISDGVSGGRHGILALNAGTGSNTVTAHGAVSGGGGYGIIAVNGTFDVNAAINTGGFVAVTDAGTDLTVNTYDTVSGGFIGIYAFNRGTGLTKVTATGTVTGTTGTGIFAIANNSAGTGLSVEAAAVTGRISGIVVQNSGGGLTSVKATGTVTGTNSNGISATAFSTGTGLSIEAAAVNGHGVAINAQNFGGGLTSVKATGPVTSTGNTGIFVLANNAGTGLSVDVAAVIGAAHGIYAENRGSGLISIKASGTVTGTAETGIYAYANSLAGTGLSVEAAAVSGGTYGILAQNDGGGLTGIKATGTVTGSNRDGINAYASNAAGTGLSIETAAVNGAITGITALNRGGGVTQVTATGPVSGTSRYGIVATDSLLSFTGSGDLSSINGQIANPPTDVIVRASGGVTGGLAGVLAFNNGTGRLDVDTRGGLVSGGARDGIIALNSNAPSTPTDLSVTSDAVSGARHGIVALNSGAGSNTVTAHGAVSGGASGYGIAAVNGAFNVYGAVNSGTIATTGNAGTDLTVNAAGTVSGGLAGIYAYNQGTGLTKVTATGTVTGTNGHGIYAAAWNTSGAGLSIDAATVSGNSWGILAYNDGGGLTSVKATGMVTGTTGIGILAIAGNAVGAGLSVEAAAVTGDSYGINVSNNGGGFTSVKASGVVTGTTDTGIYAIAGNAAGTGLSVDVAAVTGYNSGISAQNFGGGLTSIKASGTVSGTMAYGISASVGSASAGLSVETAAVSGALSGIYTDNKGVGPTQITVGGMASGGTTAIDAISVGTPVIIDVTGTGGLRNASGAMTDLALRTVGGSATLTNAGVITGVVQFGASGNTFDNSGTWNTAGGTSTFGGVTDVMTNRAGGTLNAAGVGAVATTTLDNLGSFVNQGRVTLVNNKIGDVLKINGNTRFDSGSVYALDIDGAGNSDRILVSGSAQLGGTLSLNATLGTQVAVGTRYTVLTATGGVSGKWSSVQGTAFLTLAPDSSLSDTYDANNSYLEATQMTLVQPRPFVAAALTQNQIGAASGLDSIPKSGALFSAVGLLPNDIAARNAFDQLSGEAQASVRTALAEGSHFVRSGILDRLLSASNTPGAAPVPVMSYAPGGPVMVGGTPREQFSLWGQAYGAWGRWNGNGNATGLTQSLGGLSLGLDTPLLGTSIVPLRVGVMAGYGNSSFSVGARGSSGISDNYHLGAYAGTSIGGFGLRAGLAHTWHDIRTTRIVNFPGFNDMLRANYAGRTMQLFGDLGYKMNFGAFALEPFANLAYVNLHTSAFREVGGPSALSAAASRSSQTFTTLGARGAFTVDIAGMAATLRGTLGWRHAFGAVIPGSVFAFAGGAPFSVSGIAIARNAAVAEADLDVAIAPGATLGVAYNGQLARSAQDHAIKGNLAVRF